MEIAVGRREQIDDVTEQARRRRRSRAACCDRPAREYWSSPSISPSMRCMRTRISSSISRVSPLSSPAAERSSSIHCAEVRDAAQRGAEVVRSGVGERIQLAVAAFEGEREFGQLLAVAHLLGHVHGVRHHAVRGAALVLERLHRQVEEALAAGVVGHVGFNDFLRAVRLAAVDTRDRGWRSAPAAAFGNALRIVCPITSRSPIDWRKSRLTVSIMCCGPRVTQISAGACINALCSWSWLSRPLSLRSSLGDAVAVG